MDERTDEWKIERLYRTLLQAGAIKKEKVEHLNSDITGLYNDIDKQLIKDLQKTNKN